MDVSTNDLTLQLKAWNLLPSGAFDAFFANPVTMVCAQAELGARPLASVVNILSGLDVQVVGELLGGGALHLHGLTLRGISDLPEVGRCRGHNADGLQLDGQGPLRPWWPDRRHRRPFWKPPGREGEGMDGIPSFIFPGTDCGIEPLQSQQKRMILYLC